jgi:hypothetical protein
MRLVQPKQQSPWKSGNQMGAAKKTLAAVFRRKTGKVKMPERLLIPARALGILD